MNQLSIDFARQQADRGMANALVGAENIKPEWADTALAALTFHAESHRHFAAFEVVEAVKHNDALNGVNPRAWGGIFRKALKAGIIRKTSLTLPHPKRHACPAILYRSNVYQG